MATQLPKINPFWRYFGAKWRLAGSYPKPRFSHIIEPFAGAAGFSCNYPHLDVTLVEKNELICEAWRWLTQAPPSEALRIPIIKHHIDELPAWVPEGALVVIGFCMNTGIEHPCEMKIDGVAGWDNNKRVRTARDMARIRHWKIVEGGYDSAPNVEACWFIDPPYEGPIGRFYKHNSNSIDFTHLAAWCKSRRGQVTVCESQTAKWLPFTPLSAETRPGRLKGGAALVAGKTLTRSTEAIWTNDSA